MISEKSLIKLNQKCNELYSKFNYSIINNDDYNVTFLAKKGTSFLGYKQGCFEQFQMQRNGLKVTKKIRANCKSYLEILRDNENQIIQIKDINQGNIDCIHQAYYEDGIMYLFPFTKTGEKYPTYSYVSRSIDGFVQEEYMVNENQIIYEQYEKKKDVVNYESINYVINGKYPVLGKESGVFTFNPFEYKVKLRKSWCDNKKDIRIMKKKKIIIIGFLFIVLFLILFSFERYCHKNDYLKVFENKVVIIELTKGLFPNKEYFKIDNYEIKVPYGYAKKRI